MGRHESAQKKSYLHSLHTNTTVECSLCYADCKFLNCWLLFYFLLLLMTMVLQGMNILPLTHYWIKKIVMSDLFYDVIIMMAVRAIATRSPRLVICKSDSRR